MSDLITDEMVEEALEASYDPPKEPGRTFLNRDYYRSLWAHHMRAALEAIAPLIAAKAWEEGYAEGGRGRMWDSTNPYQTRADAIERHPALYPNDATDYPEGIS